MECFLLSFSSSSPSFSTGGFHIQVESLDVTIINNFLLIYWAQLFEGRLALNPGLNLTRVSFSGVQKDFLG